jgi:ABC-type sugar transport system substrate-binding protein
VICLHSTIPGCAATLGFDERHTGNIVGEYAAQLLKARYGAVKGEVANLQGLLGQGLNTDRSGGFTDVMAKYPDVKVVAQAPTDWDPAKAVSVTENWLTAYPKLDLIYGNSDSLTVPALNAIDRAGKQKQVMVVSVDGTTPGLNAVKSGAMESTVLLAPQYSGFWKAYFPYLIVTKHDPRKEILIQGVLVTKDNVDMALKLNDDSVNKIETFPFEKSLQDILKSYGS